MRIADTLHIGEIIISPALLGEAEQDARLEILEDPHPMQFDREGNLW